MANANNTAAIVFDKETDVEVAKIILNGYNISAGGPLGRAGAMRSFRLVEGALRDQWTLGLQLKLHSEDGRIANAKVAALPVEKGSLGLIEFL